ncbi:fimbrial protein [Pseudomonas sp. 22526]|uniref:fimbrial protein n=1 Tax=Pseudomonas sp. 22526 TaxID=3453937 RepID=UPI003F86D63F
MKSTTDKTLHTVVARCLSAIVFTIIVASPSARAAHFYVTAFGHGTLSIPENSASGKILAREYITPMQACGQNECYFKYLNNYELGLYNATGPRLQTNVPGISTRMLINGQAYEGQTFKPPIKFSQPLEVQLLSNGQPNSGGSLAGSLISPTYFRFQMNDTYLSIRMEAKITPISGTCSVQNQTVTLPKTALGGLGQVGSTAGAKNFQIQINNCPKGYNRIGYTLEPVGGVIENTPGVLPLTAGSTAHGVKIQIMDDKGRPATMGTSVTVDAYNKETGGSYAIPMQASYIRTDATATPGTVNGALNVLMDYR